MLLCVAAFAAACGDKPQTINSAQKKSDAQAWQGAQSRYVTPGWKEGDRASWEAQLRARSLAQNEYIRTND